jgi:hypothetical protein
MAISKICIGQIWTRGDFRPAPINMQNTAARSTCSVIAASYQDWKLAVLLASCARMLAPRCVRLLGLDIVEDPLAAARLQCAEFTKVRFERMQIPLACPDEHFDLIVVSEVLYSSSAADVGHCAHRVLDTLLPEGVVLLVTWIGQTDDPSSGDTAADHFIACVKHRMRVAHHERHSKYRLEFRTSA